MSNKHELDNMIFQLKNKTDLEKTIFTKKALLEILGYLQENEKLKAELEELKKNAIVPKFKLNEIVFYHDKNDFRQGKIVSIGYGNKGQALTYFYYNVKPMYKDEILLNADCLDLEEKFIYTREDVFYIEKDTIRNYSIWADCEVIGNKFDNPELVED